MMLDASIDWFIVFSNDQHLSEYTSECDRYLAKITGFTGSAGTLLVGADEAYMWTDSRYFVQAASQLEGKGITLMKSGLPEVPRIEDFLFEHVWEGQSIAFDLKTISFEDYRKLSLKLPKSVEITDGVDILKKSVPQMPKRSFEKIVKVPEKNAGRSAGQKIQKLREKIRKEYVSEDSYTYIVSDLPSIMWLFNLRGSDISYVPVAYSYAMITEFGAYLYVMPGCLEEEDKHITESSGVIIKDYTHFYADLAEVVTDVILADPFGNNAKLLEGADSRGILKECSDPVLIPKAYKNDAEINGMKECHIKDAVTMIKFIKKIGEMADKNELTDEYRIGGMLDEMRIEGGAEALSFKTICAYGEDSAIVHYIAHESTAKSVEPEGFLLVDSGGQYRFKGTTDITRTIPLSSVSDEEKKVYTTVLKGNLRLMDMIFPKGYKGTLLDAAAEGPLWDEGYFCGHGIGHGVGCYLSVHESEVRISRRDGEREVNLFPGAIVSDEPGVYLEGKFGVRLENLLLVVNAGKIDGYDMCCFVPLTLVPFDARAIDFSMLTDNERKIFADYNSLIIEKVGDYLDEEELRWLKDYIDNK